MKTVIKNVTVIGAGLMGHGIAQDFASSGYEVVLHSRSVKSLNRAVSNITANLEQLSALGAVATLTIDEVLANIRRTTKLDDAVVRADLVIETISEDRMLKRRLFDQLNVVCPPAAILASNTSSLTLDSFISFRNRRDKILIMHFVNPPFLIPIVEVVRGSLTSDATLNAVWNTLVKMGKRPILVRKEVPGLVLNRLQLSLLREALSLVQEGVAPPEDIDAIITGSLGRRWAVAGIFEVFDLAGWDLILTIASNLLPPQASSLSVLNLLTNKVGKGELGVKTGHGFYRWTPQQVKEVRHRLMNALIRIDELEKASSS